MCISHLNRLLINRTYTLNSIQLLRVLHALTDIVNKLENNIDWPKITSWYFSVCIGNSMICSDTVFGINTASDISKLVYVFHEPLGKWNLRQFWSITEWYLCQISRTNYAIIMLIIILLPASLTTTTGTTRTAYLQKPLGLLCGPYWFVVNH